MWETAHFEQLVDFQRQMFSDKMQSEKLFDSQKVCAFSWLESTPIEANDKFPIHITVH